MRKHRKSEGFNLAFLDIMACGLGAVVLVFMLVKHNVTEPTVEVDLLQGDVQRLDLQRQELQQIFDQLQNLSQSDSEKIAELKARLGQLDALLAQKERSLVQKKN